MSNSTTTTTTTTSEFSFEHGAFVLDRVWSTREEIESAHADGTRVVVIAEAPPAEQEQEQKESASSKQPYGYTKRELRDLRGFGQVHSLASLRKTLFKYSCAKEVTVASKILAAVQHCEKLSEYMNKYDITREVVAAVVKLEKDCAYVDLHIVKVPWL